MSNADVRKFSITIAINLYECENILNQVRTQLLRNIVTANAESIHT